LVSKEVRDEILKGSDYLTACEITRPHMEGLREAFKEASEIMKEKEGRLNVVNFPFTDVEDIRAVISMEICDMQKH
jgi:hypothetical protein